MKDILRMTKRNLQKIFYYSNDDKEKEDYLKGNKIVKYFMILADRNISSDPK